MAPRTRGAWLAGGVLITLLDLVFHLPERIIIPIAHFGCVLFPGSAEMTTLLRLLPIYAAAMLIGGGNANR